MVVLRLKDENFNFKITTIINKNAIIHLNKWYNNNLFLNLPEVINTNILNYHNEFIGDIANYEDKYKNVRDEFKSITYSNIIYYGCNYWYDGYDGADPMSMYDFVVPRLKKARGTTKRDVYFNEITEGIYNGHVNKKYFMGKFINYEKTIFELILLLHDTLSDYADFIKYHYDRGIHLNYTIFKRDSPKYFFYTVEIDSDDEHTTEDGVCEIMEERRRFYISYNRKCKLNGTLKEFYNLKY